jgi:hypothetical protein
MTSEQKEYIKDDIVNNTIEVEMTHSRKSYRITTKGNVYIVSHGMKLITTYKNI